MALNKAQLARLAAEKLGIPAPNEPFDADDEATFIVEIDTLKAELEARIFSGVVLWEDDEVIPQNLIPGFLMALLPAVAPRYGSTTIAALPSGMADEGYRELCRQFTVGYNPDTMGATMPTATSIDFSPVGGIEAANVQAAIAEVDRELRPGALSVVFNSTALEGDKVSVIAAHAMTLNGWNLVAENECSLTLDVRRATFANYPVTVSIAGTQKPQLVAEQKAQSTAVDTWTTAIEIGDVLEFVVDSADGLTTVATLTLTYLR